MRETYMVTDRMLTYSLADLVRIVGAKRRSLQLWADAGAIQAEPDSERAGRGVHRRFSRNEAIVACVLHPFAQRTMAIGELRALGDVLRRRFVPHWREAIEGAIEGKTDSYLAVVWTDQHREITLKLIEPGVPPSWPELMSLANKNSFAGVIMLNPYLAGLR